MPFVFVCLPANDIFSWTSFLVIEGSELMYTSFLVAYHITSFMLYESSHSDVRLSVTPCFQMISPNPFEESSPNVIMLFS